ncbi:MAG: YfcC family protein [Desulfobacterales bacterium]|nr:YfcC family protein [Desulfobacterales bacterium]
MARENASESLIELRVFLATIILLGILIIVAGAASYLIPAGNLTESISDGQTIHTYARIDQTPVPVWKIALSPLMCVTGKNGPKIVVLILFILIIGGSFAVMNNSGILPKMLSDLVGRFAHQKRLFLVINVLIFSLLGSCLGILEEIVPMILIFVPLAYRMGWDATTGMAIPFLSAGFGFAAATFNPFTVGTAQKLADVPLFSGLALRLPFFCITTTVVALYLLYYTRKIEKDPSKSASYAFDEKIRKKIKAAVVPDFQGSAKGAMLWMGLCFFLIAGVVLSGPVVPVVQDLAFPLIALIFLVMGIGVGLMAGGGVKRAFGHFFRGLADFAPAIVLILMAAAVGYLIEVGNVLDTILFTISNLTQSLGKQAAVLLIYIFQMLMNMLVPSGTGQAVLTIPILAPLGDMIGITRQTVVLAYQFGDGFSNLIWPTNPMLLIAIGLAGINYRSWFRFVLPIQVVLMGLCILFLMIAVNIHFS